MDKQPSISPCPGLLLLKLTQPLNGPLQCKQAYNSLEACCVAQPTTWHMNSRIEVVLLLANALVAYLRQVQACYCPTGAWHLISEHMLHGAPTLPVCSEAAARAYSMLFEWRLGGWCDNVGIKTLPSDSARLPPDLARLLIEVSC